MKLTAALAKEDEKRTQKLLNSKVKTAAEIRDEVYILPKFYDQIFQLTLFCTAFL
jgi:hypothetical protein